MKSLALLSLITVCLAIALPVSSQNYWTSPSCVPGGFNVYTPDYGLVYTATPFMGGYTYSSVVAPMPGYGYPVMYCGGGERQLYKRIEYIDGHYWCYKKKKDKMPSLIW